MSAAHTGAIGVARTLPGITDEHSEEVIPLLTASSLLLPKSIHHLTHIGAIGVARTLRKIP
jgi:hypothetical protein